MFLQDIAAARAQSKALEIVLTASTPAGKETGEKLGEAYGRVASNWAGRLTDSERVSKKMRDQWSADLRDALEEDLTNSIVSKTSSRWREAGLTLPDDETTQRFAKTASRGALGPDAKDLLERLQDSASNTNNRLPVSDYLSPSRTSQTAAQISDMADDRFNGILARWFKKEGQITGRTRWRTAGAVSRHANLNGQVRELGGDFDDNGRKVKHPRRPGGHPGHWSSCACVLEYELDNGRWIAI